jgi:prophage antirepressor-like protein
VPTYADATEMIRPLEAADKAKNFLGHCPVNLISEAELYQVNLQSQRTNPIARTFQNWVTRVVLPAIRKGGAYIAGEEKVATSEISGDELVLKAVAILQRKIERLTAEPDAKQAVITEHLENIAIDEFRALR